MSDLVSVKTAYPAVLSSLIEDTMHYAAASRAGSTQLQYTKNWKGFLDFCEAHGLQSLPSTVQVVAVYLSSLAKASKAVSTVSSHLAAIKYFHDRNRISLNWSDPVLTEVMAGIRRSSTRKVIKAEAILPEDLTALVSTVSDGTSGLRDRAIMLVGFAGAFRRSEITALTVENIEFCDDGLVIHLDRSKTDQEGRGSEVCIPHSVNKTLCPVIALQAWLHASGIESGPVFRRISKTGLIGGDALSEEGIRLILAKAVEKSGLEASGRISPHSLRAGFCTTAALKGASLVQIGRHARHCSTQTTMGYVRVAERFKDHAGTGLL